MAPRNWAKLWRCEPSTCREQKRRPLKKDRRFRRRPTLRRPNGHQALRDVGQREHQRWGDVPIHHGSGAEIEAGPEGEKRPAAGQYKGWREPETRAETQQKGRLLQVRKTKTASLAEMEVCVSWPPQLWSWKYIILRRDYEGHFIGLVFKMWWKT